MSGRIGVAVFGLGRAGLIHTKNILNNTRLDLLYVVELDISLAKRHVEALGAASVAVVDATCTSAFTDKRVEAIIICTPTGSHEELVTKGIEHQKAIFCEKPISSCSETTERLYKKAEESNLPLFCALNRRFDPSVSKLQKKVSSGEIGKVLTLKTCSRDHPLPSQDYLSISNGIFHDCAIHDIDMVCWINGQFPKQVYTIASAHSTGTKERNDVDTALITLKFPDDSLACIDVGRISNYGYDQRVEVLGTEGMLISENQRETELRVYNGKGTAMECPKYSFLQRYQQSYWLALEHFIDVIQGRAEILVKSKEVLAISLIANACDESIKTGQPVTLIWN